MMTLTKDQGNAMAEQVERVSNNPNHLRQIILNQKIEIETQQKVIQELRERLRAQSSESPAQPQKVLQFNGRDVGTQSDLARRWQVKPYTVSRKRDQLEKITDADGKTWYYLDQPRPPRRKKSK